MNTLPEGRAIEVLLVEDSPGDVRLTQEAFADAKMSNNLQVVNDGIEAMRFLRREEPYQEARLPDLILLDLNMPRMDGREVLAELAGDHELSHIPVVVLTSSAAEEDIVRSYELNANCYITKPVDLDQFLAVIAKIDDFWLRVVKLPPRAR